VKLLFLNVFFISCIFTYGETVFEVGFNGKISPKGKLVPENIMLIGKPLEYCEGINGQALIIQAKPSKAVRFVFKNGLLPEQGSISFWVCPTDWNYADSKFHIFFNAHYYDKNSPEDNWGKDKTAHTRILIYKYGNKNIEKGGLALPLFYFKDNKVNWALNLPGAKMTDWKPGKWHFITFVWQQINNKPYCTYYIDGERTGIISKEFDFSGTAVLTVGGTWGDKGRTAIDEFKIYSEPLNKEQITQEFEEALEAFYSKKAEKGE
jgi:hypothetical protein